MIIHVIVLYRLTCSRSSLWGFWWRNLRIQQHFVSWQGTNAQSSQDYSLQQQVPTRDLIMRDGGDVVDVELERDEIL